MEATTMEDLGAPLDLEVIGIPMDTNLTLMVMVEKLKYYRLFNDLL